MTHARELFRELKRRNVLRAVIVYAAAVWALAQGISQLSPAFGLPDWATRWFVIACAIGFPLWVVFAWFYELTPEGIKRESEIDRSQSITRQTGRKLDYWIIGILAVAVVLLATNTLVWHKGAGLAEQTADSAGAPLPIPAKSIAVLPFENLSTDKANVYFAAGMQDEILSRLAEIEALKVISRTSTERYPGHPEDLRTIGRQLGVATILEGSVQKAGDSLHIAVQLIDASTDAQLWAHSYDGDLTDMFGVERDVAENVANALQARLLPAEAVRVANIPTTDPQAYDLYLRANYHFRRADGQDALAPSEAPQAIALYQQVLARDPRFALAASGLAMAHLVEYWFAVGDNAMHLAAAKAAAEQALGLQPDLGQGHLALALWYYWGHRDYQQASRELGLARRALPNSAEVAFYLGAIARREARWKDAIAGFQRAAALDPLYSRYPEQLAQLYQMLRRYAQADQMYARAVALAQDPADERVRQALNDVLWKGDLAPLHVALAGLVPDSHDFQGNTNHVYQLAWLSRDFATAAKTAEAAAATDWDNHTNVWLPARLYLAWAYEAAGRTARAKALYGGLKHQAENALGAQPDNADLHLALAFADAGLGLEKDAAQEGGKVATLVPVSKDAFSGPAYLAQIAVLDVRMGHNAAALDTLEQLLAIPSGLVVSPALLRLDPAWDPIRHDPRFQALLKQYAKSKPPLPVTASLASRSGGIG